MTTRRNKITLRPVANRDLDTFFIHQADEAARHMAAFVTPNPDDRVAFDRHWSKILADPTIDARTIVADDAVAGHIVRFYREDVPEITYWIDRAWWGRGVATAALALFVSEMPARPLSARVAKDNPASIRVLEKCGFRQTGTDTGFAVARGREIEEVLLTLF